MRAEARGFPSHCESAWLAAGTRLKGLSQVKPLRLKLVMDLAPAL